VQTQEEMDRLWLDQAPFHFADPLDPRIAEYNRWLTAAGGSVASPAVLRHFAVQDYGGIEVEDRLGEIPQPVLVLAGRRDRVCSLKAAEAIVRGVPDGELVVFEHSAHMTFVEEPEKYLDAVDDFLRRRR
jgi:pimeloyl-ACP methyl ester carboxylesterase